MEFTISELPDWNSYRWSSEGLVFDLSITGGPRGVIITIKKMVNASSITTIPEAVLKQLAVYFGRKYRPEFVTIIHGNAIVFEFYPIVGEG